MHQNRQMALQGMTKEEMEIAEQCIQKFEPESTRRPQISRNAHVSSGRLSMTNEIALSGVGFNSPLHDVGQGLDPALLYEDVHDYEAIQCWVTWAWCWTRKHF